MKSPFRSILALLYAPICATATATVFLAEDHVIHSGEVFYRMLAAAPHSADVSRAGEIAICYADAFQSAPAADTKKWIYEADGVFGPGTATIGDDMLFVRFDACFDVNGVLNTFTSTGGQQVMIHKRRTTNGYETLLFEPIPFEPKFGLSQSLVDFFLGDDGRLHVVEFIQMHNSTPDRTVLWGTFADEKWSFTTVDGWHGERLFAARVDARGDLHLLGTEAGNKPFSTILVYYRWDGEELHPETLDAPPDNEYLHVHSFGDMDLAGTPRCIATQDHFDGDLMIHQGIHFYERGDDGTWNNETIAGSALGYAGTTGNNHTGAECHLRMDHSGGAHIVFLDTAVDADGSQRNGNLRYHYRSADSPEWINFRMFPQSYPATDGTGNIHTFNIAGMTVSRDGSYIDLIGAATVRPPGVESGDVLSIDVHHLRTYNSHTLRSSPDALKLNHVVLGRIDGASAASLDQDSNGLIDGADLVAVPKS